MNSKTTEYSFKKGDVVLYESISNRYLVVSHVIDDTIWFVDKQYNMSRSYFINRTYLIADGTMFDNDKDRFNYIDVLNALQK